MPVPSEDTRSVRTRVLGWVRRRPVVSSVVVLLLAGRVALPSIVRSQLEKQVTAALTGRLTVGDVDLSLLRGSLALEDVALRADEAPPDEPPIVAFRRVYLNLGYFGLFRHTLRVQKFELEAPALALTRLHSGEVPLIGPRPAAVPEPEQKAEEAGTPWNVMVDEALLREGRLRLKDEVPDPPQTADLALDALGLKNFKLLRTADGRPGQGVIEAKFGDGAIRLDNVIRTRREGFELEITLDVSNLPLDDMQLHAPQLGWSGLAGRLDAHIVFRAEPNRLPGSRGSLAVRDLRIDVPGEEAPALAWRKLVVDIDELSLIHQRAIVKTVTLDGGSVLVTPKAPAPLPLLAGILKPAPADAPPPSPPPEPAKPWTWKVGKVELADTKASVTLEPPPLLIEVVNGTVSGLDSAPGTQAEVDVQVRHQEGTVGITGTVGLDPLALNLKTQIAKLALGPLAAASGASPVLLPGGTLDADLGIRAEQGTLALDGKLGVADLSVRPPTGEDFALGWQRLDLAIRELRVPGAVPGPPPPATEPIRADLDELRLVAPVVSLTRDPTGLVLPTSIGSAPPPEASPAAAPAAESPPGRPLALSLGQLALEKGQVSLVDRAVKPFYKGTISAMNLRATDLRFPESTFAAFTFTATLPGNAPLKLEGKQAKGTASITAEGRKLPLKQFNPYVTLAGYSIADGALTVGSTVRYGAAGYDSKTKIEFDKLGVAGAEGDSLFKQKVGIPLQLAISLLRDVQGRIALNIPVSGDKRGTRVALGSIVAEALVKAIIGALASPLKMFGAVVDLAGGGGAAAAPEPIPYRPGLLDPEDAARVEQVAGGLAGAPGLKITLNGMAGGPDVRGLQEKAVLADLEAKQGVFGGIRHLAKRGERNAIRDALAARATGGKAELSPEHQKTLDEWAGEKKISDDDLRALANARAEGLRDRLVKQHGIDAARVSLGEVDVKRADGTPGVGVGLGF